MQVNNSINSTSFGMAFKKPTPDQMEQFTNYVSKGRKVKQVQRGIKQIQKEQANNPHFDIVYVTDPAHKESNHFSVVPFSEKAKKMFQKRELRHGEGTPSRYSKFQEEFLAESKVLEEKKAGKIRKGIFAIKSIYKFLKTAVYTYTHPVEILPKNLRYANELATSQANAVEKQIAKERIISKTFSNL